MSVYKKQLINVLYISILIIVVLLVSLSLQGEKGWVADRSNFGIFLLPKLVVLILLIGLIRRIFIYFKNKQNKKFN